MIRSHPGTRDEQIGRADHALPVGRTLDDSDSRRLELGTTLGVAGLTRTFLDDGDLVAPTVQPFRHDGARRAESDHHRPHYPPAPGMRRKSA